MARVWLIAALLTLTTLIACRDQAPETGTPIPAPSLAAQPIQAEAVSLLTLVRNPDSFEKVYIPYGGYWSTPFCKWQGSLSSVHSVSLAAQAAR